jgi:hypothetical protein
MTGDIDMEDIYRIAGTTIFGGAFFISMSWILYGFKCCLDNREDTMDRWVPVFHGTVNKLCEKCQARTHKID